jgi:hypothetical protein
MQSGCNQGTISPSNRARLQPGGGLQGRTQPD